MTDLRLRLPAFARLLASTALDSPALRARLAARLLPRLWEDAVLRSLEKLEAPGGWAAGALAAEASGAEARGVWIRLCCLLPPASAADVAVLDTMVDASEVHVPDVEPFLEFLGVVQRWIELRGADFRRSWRPGPLAREVLTVRYLRGLRRRAARAAGRNTTGTESELPPLLRWPEDEVPCGLLAMAAEWAEAVRRKTPRGALDPESPMCRDLRGYAQRTSDTMLRDWIMEMVEPRRSTGDTP